MSLKWERETQRKGKGFYGVLLFRFTRLVPPLDKGIIIKDFFSSSYSKRTRY